MKDFETSLLREKFVIKDVNAKAGDKPVVALSNRLVLDLKNNKGDISESFVVRAHNMHLCARMGARILQTYMQRGPLLNRASEFEWEEAWKSITDGYEHSFNPARWIAIYNKGKSIFQAGDRHPFLDLIEKCDTKRKSGQYDDSIPLAEAAFKQTGKEIDINYDGNVALAVHLTPDTAKLGIILRGADRTTTFSFTAHPRDKKPLSYAQCLSAAAAFLEGIQLAFMYGMNTEKIKIGMIDRHSREEKQTKEAGKRLQRLTSEISNFEAAAEVFYRPEKPEFHHIVNDAEKVAQKMLQKKR